jgi:hypothetical protein
MLERLAPLTSALPLLRIECLPPLGLKLGPLRLGEHAGTP